MEVFKSIGKLPERVTDYFEFDKLDAFHSIDINTVLSDHNWECILITEDKDAFFHVYTKNLIKETEYFDIEPLFGYAGPVTNSTNHDFITKALKIYSEHCISNKIVAELFRFNPLLSNHIPFLNSIIKISSAKEIIIVNCHKERETQLAEFNRLGKRYINNIINETEINYYDNKSLEEFQKHYNSSLKKHNADKIWYFDNDFYLRAQESAKLILAEVKYKDKLQILSIIIKSELAYYHFITSILEPRIRGLNDYLILTLSLSAARNGSKKLILGGGNTSKDDDPLLLYKKNFNKVSSTFFIGKAVYIPDVYNHLCVEFAKSNPKHINLEIFLKYRLQ